MELGESAMKSYQRKKLGRVITNPLYFLLVSTIALFIADSFVMLVLPSLSFGLLKALLVTIFATPLFLIFLYYPFKIYIAQKQKKEEELININFHLQRSLSEWSDSLEQIQEALNIKEKNVQDPKVVNLFRHYKN